MKRPPSEGTGFETLGLDAVPMSLLMALAKMLRPNITVNGDYITQGGRKHVTNDRQQRTTHEAMTQRQQSAQTAPHSTQPKDATPVSVLPALPPPLAEAQLRMQGYILELMSATTDDGSLLFCHSYQWYAIYRVLTDHCQYPRNPKDFKIQMEALDLGQIAHPCKYDNYRRMPTETRLAVPLSLWGNYLPTATEKERCLINTATRLTQMLGITM